MLSIAAVLSRQGISPHSIPDLCIKTCRGYVINHGNSANAAVYRTAKAPPTSRVYVEEGAWSAKEISAMVRSSTGSKRRGRREEG